MNTRQITLLSVAGAGGLAVLASYVLIVKDYKNHDYWVGIPESSKRLFYVFWLLAAIGFVWYIVSQVVFPSQDKAGLFSHGSWIRPTIIGVILLCSLLWSIFVYMAFNKQWSKVWTSLVLVIVGLFTLLLLAGEAEAQAPWHRILGLMLFAMTTVLIDPVMWNSKFILYPTNN